MSRWGDRKIRTMGGGGLYTGGNKQGKGLVQTRWGLETNPLADPKRSPFGVVRVTGGPWPGVDGGRGAGGGGSVGTGRLAAGRSVGLPYGGLVTDVSLGRNPGPGYPPGPRCQGCFPGQ